MKQGPIKLKKKKEKITKTSTDGSFYVVDRGKRRYIMDRTLAAPSYSVKCGCIRWVPQSHAYNPHLS